MKRKIIFSLVSLSLAPFLLFLLSFIITNSLILSLFLFLASFTLLFVLLLQNFEKTLLTQLKGLSFVINNMLKGDFTDRVYINSTNTDQLNDFEEILAKFNQLIEELEKFDSYQTNVVSNVSHELRTPIAAMQGQLENIADGIVGPSREVIDGLLLQVVSLSNLITYLLDLSRIDAGATKLNKKFFPLKDFLQEILQSLSTFEGEKKLKFIVDVRPNNFSIYADKDRFRQIIVNLISNAIKNSPNKSVIYIDAYRQEKRAVIEIEDSGSGIKKEERLKIFKRFAQGGEANKSGGTGIGLSIVKWAIDLHGGNVEVVDSQKGARFRVELPLERRRHHQ